VVVCHSLEQRTYGKKNRVRGDGRGTEGEQNRRIEVQKHPAFLSSKYLLYARAVSGVPSYPDAIVTGRPVADKRKNCISLPIDTE
jgi:hypothetical protein